MLGLLAGCASQPPEQRREIRSSVPAPTRASLGERAASVALQQVGVPYRYGGDNRDGFDCSGLVQFSYSRAGKQLSRTTGQLWSSTATVARPDLQVGDLVFFNIEGKISHVGMYIGEQRFVHAPSSGRSVSVASLSSPYYARTFVRGGRPR